MDCKLPALREKICLSRIGIGLEEQLKTWKAEIERNKSAKTSKSLAPVTFEEVIKKEVQEQILNLIQERMESGLCPHCGLSLEGVKI